MRSQNPQADGVSPAATGKRPLLHVLLAIWLVCVVAGMTRLTRYSFTPGASGQPPAEWPGASRLERSPARSTLLVFAHPKCPCTRATLNELDRMFVAHREQLTVHVVFVVPPGAPEGWEETALRRRALEIPGVRVRIDEDGEHAKLFRVATSGHALVYDAHGSLRFSGGLTAARGHEGESVGQDAIQGILQGGRAGRLFSYAVFGCPLLSEDLSAGAGESGSTPTAGGRGETS